MILPLSKSLGVFFNWWFGALRAALSVQNSYDGRGATEVSLSDGWVTIRQHGNVLQRFSETEAELKDGLADKIRWARRITGVLENDQLLIVDAIFPEAAEADLSEAIALQLDSLTPFNEEEACFDYAIIERDAARHVLHVKLAVAPRHLTTELSALIANAGKRLDRVVAAQIPEGFSRQPQFSLTTPLVGNNWAKVGGNILAIGMIGLVVLVTYMSLDRRQQEAQMLEDRLVKEIQLSQKAKALEQEITELQREFLAPANRRLGAIPVIGILEEVTRILPDDSWIMDIQISPEKLNFTGLSGNAPGLLQLFEKSALFQDAAFTAPLTRDQQFNLERFSISLGVVSNKHTSGNGGG